MSRVDLRAACQRLVAAGRDLSEASDELNMAVNACNALIKKYNLVVSTFAVYKTVVVDRTTWHYSICYDKFNGKWGIGIVVAEFPRSGSPEEKRWEFSASPRNLRSEAAHHIPMLLEKMAVSAMQLTENLRQARRSVSDTNMEVEAILDGCSHTEEKSETT